MLDGVFRLKGYYFKKAEFRSEDVARLEPVVVSERWFQRRLGTLLSRSTRFTIPSGKNVNWKVVLRDGREYFLPGEMGRPGLWKAGGLGELKSLLESGIGKSPA